MKRICFAMVLLISMVLGLSSGLMAQDKPSFSVNWYGYFKLDGAYDQRLTSHGNFIMWVNPQQAGKSDDQFNMTANETRLGLNLTGNNYKNVNVAGKLEFDLYAGVTGGTIAENKPMLQLRHAYFSVQKKNSKLLAGQSWDLVSPLNPSTLNYPVLWACGNIGYRRPQVSLWQTFNAGNQTDITLATGFFRTIGTDLTPTFTLAAGETSEGTDDGTDDGIPSFQALFDVTQKFSSGSSVRFGVSGLWGQLKAETNLGSYEKYESWAVCGHLMFTLVSGFGFAGEAFTGSNLQSYFGGISNNSTVAGLKASGGWASAWMEPSSKVKLSAGAGIDKPNNTDLRSGRSKNFSMFGNVRYTFIPKVTVGLELSHWETDYKSASGVFTDYKNFRAQTSFILNF